MQSMKHALPAWALRTLSALASLLITAPTWAAGYSITDLGSGTIPYGINNSGQVAGVAAFGAGTAHAFLYSNGAMTDLGTLGGTTYSTASAINDNGQVAGFAYAATDNVRSFLYSNGAMTDLGTLGGTRTLAYGINNNGQVVGFSDAAQGAPNGTLHAFLFSNGAMTDLTNLSFTAPDKPVLAEATGINNSGQVAGVGYANYGTTIHALLYSNGSLIDLGTLGGAFSYAYGINNSGQVVGYADTVGFLDAYAHAFLYSNGSMIDLGTLGGTYSVAYGINNKGQVVGISATTVNGPSTAFLYSNGTMTDLNSLLPVGSDWHLDVAYGINDAGQITGFGYNSLNGDTGFLLTPAPTSCSAPVTREGQADLPWGPNLYDHSPVFKISKLGCAMTALSMSLNFVGVTNDPGTLNAFMSRNGSTDFSGLGVNWIPTTTDASSPTSPFAPPKLMRFDNLGGAQYSQNDNILNPTGAFKQVNDALCSATPHPVIVGVAGLKPRSCVPSGGLPAPSSPGHFVLITGKQVDSNGVPHYSINDPGCSSNTSLDVFNNQFVTRGIVTVPPGDISQLAIAVNDSADIMVTDPSGNLTGHDLSSGTIVQAIPGSAYFSDSINDDETGVPADVTRQVPVFQPQQGTFNVNVNGTILGTYSLSIQVYSQDGGAQPGIVLAGIEGPGSTTLYQVQLVSAPGSVSTAILVANFSSTLADIGNSLQLGLIGNSGIANSLSKKISAAQKAGGSARTNILNAFINEVNAQAGKHVTGVAVDVLLQDAASLISQNGS